jgi:hypothetical protein
MRRSHPSRLVAHASQCAEGSEPDRRTCRMITCTPSSLPVTTRAPPVSVKAHDALRSVIPASSRVAGLTACLSEVEGSTIADESVEIVRSSRRRPMAQQEGGAHDPCHRNRQLEGRSGKDHHGRRHAELLAGDHRKRVLVIDLDGLTNATTLLIHGCGGRSEREVTLSRTSSRTHSAHPTNAASSLIRHSSETCRM